MPKNTFTALTDEQIARLEDQFSIRLPVDYRQFMQHYPLRFTSDDPDDEETISEVQIVSGYDRLVEMNVNIRSPDFWFFGEHPWPNRFFVIGGDDYGNSYFLDTSGEYPGVRFQDCNDWEVGYVADSVEDFAKLLEEGSVMEDEG